MFKVFIYGAVGFLIIDFSLLPIFQNHVDYWAQ